MTIIKEQIRWISVDWYIDLFQVCEERQPRELHGPCQLPPSQEQTEEGHAGEAAGEEGGQDAVRHPAGVHSDLDPVQRAGCDEGNSYFYFATPYLGLMPT